MKKLFVVSVCVALVLSLTACKVDNKSKTSVDGNSKNEVSAVHESKVIHIENMAQYNKALKENKYVVTDLFATWCGPCKKLAPHIEKMSGEYDGKVTFLKVDVDKNNDIAVKYSVKSIPLVLFIENGEVKDKKLGYMDESEVRSMVENLIK